MDLPQAALAKTTQAVKDNKNLPLINLRRLRTVFPYALFAAFAVFYCGYFFMPDYSDHYRLFARLVFPLALFTLVAGFRELRDSTLFRLVLLYLA